MPIIIILHLLFELCYSSNLTAMEALTGGHKWRLPMNHYRFTVLVLLFVFPSSSNAATAPPAGNLTDQSALLSFKSAIAKDPFGTLHAWNNTVHFCRWPGITCGGPLHRDRVTSLDLEFLNLTGTISPYIANLTFLRRINLPGNKLYGTIPPELGTLRRLQYLNLSINSLEGDIPTTLSMCSDLESLSLRNNLLQGTIPPNISRCSKLQVLSVRNNRLVGEIPPELGLLSKLNTFSLSANNLTGRIPPSLGNLSSLVELRLQYNNLEGGIPVELANLRGLTVLDMLFNKLSGRIPEPLFNSSSLVVFGVGANQLSGSLPPDFGVHLPNLRSLFMYNNHFDGPIPQSLTNASMLEEILLVNNSFSGRVPSNLGKLSNLRLLLLGGNRLVANGTDDWDFFTSLANCSSIGEIDLADNLLQGAMPSSISNLSESLYWLTLRNNSISGRLPVAIGNLKGLEVFGVESNLLSGAIPDTVGSLSNLRVFSVYNNSLSGEIPQSMGNLTNLAELYLHQNKFTGSIPGSLAMLHKLQAMDVSYNSLGGTIPKGILGLSSLSGFLNISNNFLNGSLPEEVGSLVNLRALDVSENHFSGKIPVSLGKCIVLEYLQLGGNFFQGTIPESLSNLKGLQSLNLSHNNLSGTIPGFLETLPLQYLNLSFNDFQGEVPIFGNDTSISVVGNSRLCGGSPEIHLPSCKQTGHRRNRPTRPVLITIAVVLSVLFFLLTLVLYAKCYRTKRPRDILDVVSTKLWHFSISYRELFKATNGFASENLIGKGGFGSVYKGVIGKERKLVAVKVLNCQQPGASSSFAAECKVLRNIRHRNLVRVLTSCSSFDANGNPFKALVFEYMPRGSLETWLHSDPKDGSCPGNLGFKQRINIAFDVALALDYLHHQGQAPIVHCDLKPSNILLDDSMTAHVGDFGLARFLSGSFSTVSDTKTASIAIKGTVGYIAPEYGVGNPISIEGDLYSYGILILELFTGKSPTSNMFGDDLSIHAYVERSYPDKVVDIIDPRMYLREDVVNATGVVEESLVTLFRIGLSCSKESPRERMHMKEVMDLLHVIKDMLHES